MANPTPATTPTRKSVTGFVTKLVGDGATYGFINDEIFFQQTNVTDGPAGMGDRVFAECEYSELLPIKWNAASIRILARASAGLPTSGPLDSDPRRQSRSAMLNQQQPPEQTIPGQSLPPANSYQQHRQQRQPDVSVSQAPPVAVSMPQPQVPTMPLLDQSALAPQPDFFSPFAQQPPPMQELQPFQHDIPMGPPKLEYTSQLGSAFVQNQFMAGPLLPQPPPPQQQMLPQHQPPQQQQQAQHLRQQHQTNNRDQRGPRDNNNTKNRFNDKNDRNQANRSRNRTDKKYEQPRSSERENSAGNRSSRSGDSRDRSTGHNDARTVKRDEGSTRQSPVSHTGKAANSSKARRYEVQNIPKTSILTNLNGCNMRSRCSSSVHVPSDLKNVIVNQYLRMDVRNTPKPINFKIAQPNNDAPEDTKVTGTEDSKPTENEPACESKETVDTVSEDAASQSSLDAKTAEQITPPSSKSDMKLHHKYGVKVVLVSLPELETMYKKVFGENLDSYSNDAKTHPRLDEAITLLCNKGLNGGHSLIGGKFDPTLDGFMEGETNEFERFGKQPDLIATCRRVVQEQTGLDLGPCQGWSLISTFLYNNKSDYFSSKSSIEYSFIYLPHIWTMLTENFTDKVAEKESLQTDVPAAEEADVSGAKSVSTTDTKIETTSTDEDGLDKPADDINESAKIGEDDTSKPSEVTTQVCPSLPGNIADLKVAELKLELDKRDIKYKPNAKKAELASALQGNIEQAASGETDQAQESLAQDNSQVKDDSVAPELEEGEVAADDENTNDDDGNVTMVDPNQATEINGETGKRKSDEMDLDGQQDPKKVCKDGSSKAEKVELIKEPFLVKTRPGQLQFSLVSLHEAVQASRYDQFELSVASTVLKESLVQHLSEYILTTLIEESRQKSKEASDSCSTSSSVSNSQDIANNDTNNNNTAVKPAPAPATATGTANQTPTEKNNLVKEYAVDRYINLAFSYFDSSHMGYIQADDLFKLFNNTGLTISKRALWSLIGEGEKFNYKTLPDLLTKFPPNHIYQFPEHFDRLPGSSKDATGLMSSSKMIEHQGVRYDVEKLIHQVREAEINRVNMVQRFNDAISKHDKQESEIHELEVNQLSLSKSIKALNAEISDLKREKQNADKRAETLKKQIKDAIKTLSE